MMTPQRAALSGALVVSSESAAAEGDGLNADAGRHGRKPMPAKVHPDRLCGAGMLMPMTERIA
ncbi:hypothetical protein [Lysobacter sp. P5_B9]